MGENYRVSYRQSVYWKIDTTDSRTGELFLFINNAVSILETFYRLPTTSSKYRGYFR